MPAQPSGEPTADYQRVINGITERIRSGEYAPGRQLPSIRMLAAEYRTGETTVKAALRILRHDGLIRTHPGKGTYIPDRPPDTGDGGDR